MSFLVLIADDEELERRALRHILGTIEGESIEIVEAVNGRQAIEAAREAQPDLALLDIRMPGVDGIDAARELKTVSPRTRCVFVTAFGSFDYAREAMRLGAEEYILKPAEPSAVRATVLAALERIRAERFQSELRRKTDADGERALELLERELRESLNRDAVDGSRLEQYLQLRGLSRGERLLVVLRPEASLRGDQKSRVAALRRVCDFAEGRLRACGWFLLGGSDDAEARLAAVAAEGAEFLGPLERLARACTSDLAVHVLLGAASATVTEGRDLFAPAREALSLCRREQPVVLFETREKSAAEPLAGAARGRATVDRAMGFMRERLSEETSLAQIAAAVHCSPYHLSRLFTIHAGDTFVSVFARMRVDAAKALLKTGSYNVKEVCALVGFRDQTYFARVFRKFEGMTPAEFAAAGGRGGRAKSSET